MSEKIRNKKAESFYEVLERVEAGIVLTGAEVKSVRKGAISFEGSYVSFVTSRPTLVNFQISPYQFSKDPTYKSKRDRDLLLSKKEIDKLSGMSNIKGYSIMPLAIYFKNNMIKVEIGVCRGLKLHDRREKLKKKDVAREIAVELRGKKV